MEYRGHIACMVRDRLLFTEALHANVSCLKSAKAPGPVGRRCVHVQEVAVSCSQMPRFRREAKGILDTHPAQCFVGHHSVTQLGVTQLRSPRQLQRGACLRWFEFKSSFLAGAAAGFNARCRRQDICLLNVTDPIAQDK